MKAQASMEFLIVLAIFFSMLVLSFSMLNNVKDVGFQSIDTTKLMMAVNDIENTVNEVCVLGEGTKRVIRLPLESAEISAAGEKVIQINYKGSTGYADVVCKVSSTPGTVSGRISIEKVSGEIVIEEV